MHNLQGIIRRTTLNALDQYEKVAYMSENISNFNTNGYKAVHFEEVLSERGLAEGYEKKDFSQGSIRRTERPLDIAIDGAGFIPVTNKNGEIRYTRDGSFTTDKEGTIITYGGDIVGNGIKLDATYARLEIKENGDVYTYKTPAGKGEFKGNIPASSINLLKQNTVGLALLKKSMDK